jgi:hypothetical protein
LPRCASFTSPCTITPITVFAFERQNLSSSALSAASTPVRRAICSGLGGGRLFSPGIRELRKRRESEGRTAAKISADMEAVR